MGQVALVAGATGIIGRGLLAELSTRSDWRLRALSRSPITGIDCLPVDLRDPAGARDGLKSAGDVTHLFYAAYLPQPDLAAEVAVNGPMLSNLLEGLAAAGSKLEHAVLYQGAKVYGVHLGRIEAPFYEDETPRHLPPNFYYTQEDTLKARAARDGFGWTILRPDVIVGDIAGNPMNIAMVIGVLCAISKATGTPLRFPGSEHVYRGVFAQVTDTNLLARASLWAATAASARNQAFNYVQEPFRWERIFAKVAAANDLPLGPPMPMSLATHMVWQEEVWRKLVTEHGLKPTPYKELVGWPFGDFIFNTGFDMISDMGKIRQAGFTETIDPAVAVIDAIASLRLQKILP